MAEPILDLSKSLLKNAEAWDKVRGATDKASKRLQESEKAYKQITQAIVPMLAKDKELIALFEKKFGSLKKISTQMKSFGFSVKESTDFLRANVAIMQNDLKVSRQKIKVDKKKAEVAKSVKKQAQLLKGELKELAQQTGINAEAQKVLNGRYGKTKESLAVFRAKVNKAKQSLKTLKKTKEDNSRKLKKLIGQYNKTGGALLRFGKKVEIADKNTNLWTRTLRNNGSTFSVFRSKLLLGAFAIGLYSRSIGKLLKLQGMQQASELKVKNALVQTGMSAGITYGEIVKLTKSLQENGVVGDEVNLQMSALLLTYDNIGKDVFPATLKAANDMATTLEMGIPTQERLASTVTMLAKALQEPEKGMNALRRVGFSLDASDRRRVKTLVHLNKTQEAQNVILKAANKQYGDMAKTIKNSTLGQINDLSMAIGDLGEEFGEALLPAVLPVIEGMSSFTKSITPEGVRQFRDTIGALTAVFLGYKAITMLSTKATLALKINALDPAILSVGKLTRATKFLNIVSKATPIGVLAGAIIAFLPTLKKLRGGYKDASDEARTLADRTLEAMDALRSKTLVELSSIVIKNTMHLELLRSEMESIALAEEVMGKGANGVNKEFQIAQKALVELVPHYREILRNGEHYIVQNAQLAVAVKNYKEQLDNSTLSIEARIKAGQNLIDNINKLNQTKETELVDRLKKELTLLTLTHQKSAFMAKKDMSEFKEAAKAKIDAQNEISDNQKRISDLAISTSKRVLFHSLRTTRAESAQAVKLMDQRRTLTKERRGLIEREMRARDQLMEDLLKGRIAEKDADIALIDSQLAKNREKYEAAAALQRQEERAIELLKKRNEEIINSGVLETKSREEQIIAINNNIDAFKMFGVTYDELDPKSQTAIDNINQQAYAHEVLMNKIKAQNIVAENEIQLLQARKEAYNQFYSELADAAASFYETKNSRALDSGIKALEAEKTEIDNSRKNSKQKKADKEAIDKQIQDLEKKHHNRSLMIKAGSLIADFFISQAKAKIATAAAAQLIMFKYAAIPGGVLAAVAEIAALNSASALATGVAAASLGLGLAGLYGQKMEQGGLVGGKRHSQGGTMIEAEQGEFVMNRGAVNSLGVEAMNRINQGGSASNVTVNVSGNVMSQDFVEGELAEQIKEAVRRGTDFGIS